MLQEIIFLTNNLDKLRHLKKCAGINYFNLGVAFIPNEEGPKRKETLIPCFKAFIG